MVGTPKPSNEVIEYDSACNPVIAAGSGFAAPPEDVGTSTVIATNVSCPGGSEPGDLYVANFKLNVASYLDADGPPPTCFEPPPSVPPEITAQFATSVESDGAVLKAKINPNFWEDTRYYVEYGSGKCSEGGCASTLAAGQSLRLLAPRRTGKTTVCDAALERLTEDGWYVASVDLMHPVGAVGLAQDLTRALLANRPQLSRALTQAREGWQRLSDRVRAQAVVDLGEGVRVAFGPGPARVDPDAALSDALALPQRLAEKDGRPVALFLDELQELAAPSAPFGDPNRLQGQMRAIFQRSGQVSLLFAGSLEHAMRQIGCRSAAWPGA